MYGRKSKGVLRSQYPNDKPAYLYRRTKRGQQYKLGLDNLHFVYGKNYRNSLGDYFIMEYDKDIYKNLDYLSGSLTCRTFGKGRNMKVMVKKHDFLKSGSINYGKYDIKHEIYIPDSFMQRVEVYDKAQYEPNSLFNELRKRLSTTTKQNKTKQR
jgi:hypothetical protein